MYCVWCNQSMMRHVSWGNLFYPEKPSVLCDRCTSHLEIIDGNRCKRCSRKSVEKLCADCLWWQSEMEESLEFNFSIYRYNERMKEMVAKWKYRGDYVIGEAFKEKFRQTFRNTFSHIKEELIAIPIPLSLERRQERAFNQAEMLSRFLPIDIDFVIQRKHGEKQSKKSREERIHTENPFFITKKLNKSVVLVDDIYTTGTTLRHAASLLKSNGVPNVYSFTLIRG